ncbi:MAG: hypothetical protein GY860_11645, partial [Desulfobacteraceae bacterium]|nr:hypothetical protein [Desulfobacteraceae bacterium]
MLLNMGKDKPKTIAIISIVLFVVIAGWLFLRPNDESVDSMGEKNRVKVEPDSGAFLGTIGKSETDIKDKGLVKGSINVPPTIDYKDLEKDKTLKTLMDTRKEDLGIQKSLDMIVKSDESFIINGSRVSMKEILEKAFTKSGDVYQENISTSGGAIPGKIRRYGIHVVQPGDNIWNIHFNILKEYYGNRDIQVASKADEPGNLGFSSGVGKILKFSETMVIIYNLIEKKVVEDINLLE